MGLLEGLVELDSYDSGTEEEEEDEKEIRCYMPFCLDIWVCMSMFWALVEGMNGLPSSGFSRQSSWKLPVDAMMSKDCD